MSEGQKKFDDKKKLLKHVQSLFLSLASIVIYTCWYSHSCADYRFHFTFDTINSSWSLASGGQIILYARYNLVVRIHIYKNITAFGPSNFLFNIIISYYLVYLIVNAIFLINYLINCYCLIIDGIFRTEKENN